MTEPGESTHAGRDDREMYALFVEYRRSGDRALRNELVERHRRLAEFLARRFANRGESVDDLRQIAYVGLVKAVERFDQYRGLQFSSFATPTITGELKRHFRDKGWALRVPRRIQELRLQLDRTTAELSQELGRAPTPAEIAARVGVTVDEVLESMEAGSLYRLASLDAPTFDDPTATTTVGDGVGDPDASLDPVDDRMAVEQLILSLPERERLIVYLRFFEDRTQSEIAEIVGISQMHVSRLLMRGLEQLRAQAGIDLEQGRS